MQGHNWEQTSQVKPFAQSFWIPFAPLCAGCYPGSTDSLERDRKLRGLLSCGIRQLVSLIEPDELARGVRLVPYADRLQELAARNGVQVECQSFPIRDAGVPTRTGMKQILDAIDDGLARNVATYVHCWGGHGRTGTVITCHLIRHGHSPGAAIRALIDMRRGLPKDHYPFEGDQEPFVRTWRNGE